jgi:ectoine hydroxylase-related dioxygenase (phytanoyl-CoA dioxygenase family)
MQPAAATFARLPATSLDHPAGRRAAADAFRAAGAVVIEGAIAAAELAALRADTAELIADGGNHRGDDDYFFDRDADGVERFHRIQYIFPKGRRRSLLTAAAHPRLCALVAGLLGDDFVVSGEALVFKAAGDGRAVPVHTDGDPHRPGLGPDHLHFNVDIYLDDSDAGNGCLLAAPGSHLRRERREALAQAGFAYPGLVPVPVRAGDVIVHDCMVVHGSRATAAMAGRRTLYYEFRRRDHMLRDGLWDGIPSEAWVDNRQRILHRAIAERAASSWAAGETPFAYRPHAPPPGPGDLVDLRPRRAAGRWH